MKKVKFFSFFAFFHLFLIQAQTIVKQRKHVLDPLIIIKNKTDNLGIFINFRTNFYMPIEKNLLKNSYFSVDQLRLEMIGNINDNLSYHFKQHLNKSPSFNAASNDKVSKTTDFAYIKYKINDKVALRFGRQPMNIGIIEANYSNLIPHNSPDILQNMNIFYTGVDFTYIPIKRHQFQFQLLNNSFNRLLDFCNKEEKNHNEGRKILEDQDIKQAKIPLGYTFNWSSLWKEKKIQTILSYSLFQEAKNKYSKILALGTQFNFHPLTVDANYIYSNEDVDCEQYGTKAFQEAYLIKDKKNDKNKIATNVLYNSYILKVKYQINSRWSTFVKAIYNSVSSKDFPFTDMSNKNFRRSYSYFYGIEYLPFKNINNLKLYFFYKGQRIRFIDPIKNLNKGIQDFSLGLNYRIKII